MRRDGERRPLPRGRPRSLGQAWPLATGEAGAFGAIGRISTFAWTG